jgi:hypothetical protein
MCEYSDRLVAWLDEEVPLEDAAAIEQHLETCGTCRDSLIHYRRVSADVKAYYRAVTNGEVRRPVVTWALVASGAAAIAVAVVVWGGFLAGARVEGRPDTATSVATVATAQRSKPRGLEPLRSDPADAHGSVARGPMSRAHRRARTAPRAAEPNWLPAEPAVEIVVPADAVFPPGVVPEGISFVADLSIAADGSATWLQWRP